MAYVGVMQLRLDMPWVSDLKTKRAIVRPAVERLRARFPVSVARIGGQNSHTFEVLALCTVHGEFAWVQGVLDSVEEFLAAGEYRLSVSSAVWPLEELLDDADEAADEP